jgi:hypothetical protein
MSQEVFTPTSSGKIPYKGYETYYEVYGDLSSGVTPLICIHGGPGAGRSIVIPSLHQVLAFATCYLQVLPPHFDRSIKFSSDHLIRSDRMLRFLSDLG